MAQRLAWLLVIILFVPDYITGQDNHVPSEQLIQTGTSSIAYIEGGATYGKVADHAHIFCRFEPTESPHKRVCVHCLVRRTATGFSPLCFAVIKSQRPESPALRNFRSHVSEDSAHARWKYKAFLADGDFVLACDSTSPKPFHDNRSAIRHSGQHVLLVDFTKTSAGNAEQSAVRVRSSSARLPSTVPDVISTPVGFS